MIATYAYKAGAARANIARDVANLICGAAIGSLSAAANVPGCGVVGAAPGVWSVLRDDAAGVVIKRAGVGGDVVFRVSAVTYPGSAYYGVNVFPVANYGGAEDFGFSASFNFFAVDNMAAAGYLMVAVNDLSFLVTGYPNSPARFGAIAGELDGEFFDGGVSRAAVMQLGGSVLAGVTVGLNQPFLARIKNHAAAGDKVGGAACGLPLSVHPSPGKLIGQNEVNYYQLIPVDVWSNPKSAFLGFLRGVYFVPSVGVVTDDMVNVGADSYFVLRGGLGGAAAMALAVKV